MENSAASLWGDFPMRVPGTIRGEPYNTRKPGGESDRIGGIVAGTPARWFPTFEMALAYHLACEVRTPVRSWVYFIQRGNKGAVKIGYGSNPKKRLAALQTGSDQRLWIIGKTPGGVDLEATLHAELADFRLSGEWFRPEPRLMSRIRALDRGAR